MTREEIYQQEADSRYPINQTTGTLYTASNRSFVHGCRFGHSVNFTREITDLLISYTFFMVQNNRFNDIPRRNDGLGLLQCVINDLQSSDTLSPEHSELLYKLLELR